MFAVIASIDTGLTMTDGATFVVITLGNCFHRISKAAIKSTLYTLVLGNMYYVGKKTIK